MCLDAIRNMYHANTKSAVDGPYYFVLLFFVNVVKTTTIVMCQMRSLVAYPFTSIIRDLCAMEVWVPCAKRQARGISARIFLSLKKTRDTEQTY